MDKEEIPKELQKHLSKTILRGLSRRNIVLCE